MAATVNPLASKVSRLTKGNKCLEEANAALEREAAELDEERQMMVGIFREQLDAAAAEQKEAAAPQGGGERLLEGAPAAEAQLLEEELQRVRAAAARRAECAQQEMTALQSRLEQKDLQLRRMARASEAMGACTELDLNELQRLQATAKELEAGVEELEDECLKTRCKVEAWGIRLREVQRQAAEAGEQRAAAEEQLRKEVDGLDQRNGTLCERLGDANAVCAQLKEEVARGEAGDTSREIVERGTQTKYLSEEAHLCAQVAQLQEELRQAADGTRGGALATQAQGPREWFDLVALCLRPRDEGPAGAGAGPSVASTTDVPPLRRPALTQ